LENCLQIQRKQFKTKKNQGRRPHVSLQSLFIEATKDREERAPDIIFDIRRCTIIDNRKVKKNRDCGAPRFGI